jgi:OPT oligopeptide transporter protein
MQGQLLFQDLKLAQYGHPAPRVTFAMQMAGTAVGAVFNYIMTNKIIDNNFDTLLSIEGTNVWSGQQAQSFNSLAVAWGGLSHELFSMGGTYQWMTPIFIPGFFVPIPFWLLHKKYPNLGLNNINTAVMILYISWLCVGINSSLMAFFFFLVWSVKHTLGRDIRLRLSNITTWFLRRCMAERRSLCSFFLLQCSELQGML